MSSSGISPDGLGQEGLPRLRGVLAVELGHLVLAEVAQVTAAAGELVITHVAQPGEREGVREVGGAIGVAVTDLAQDADQDVAAEGVDLVEEDHQGARRRASPRPERGADAGRPERRQATEAAGDRGGAAPRPSSATRRGWPARPRRCRPGSRRRPRRPQWTRGSRRTPPRRSTPARSPGAPSSCRPDEARARRSRAPGRPAAAPPAGERGRAACSAARACWDRPC
jgi:hypothetical protein